MPIDVIPPFNIALLFYRAWADRKDKLDQCFELQVTKTLLLIATGTDVV